jgi:hypothetical protein
MQPNHCDLLGQVREPRAARQLMRDGHPRDQSGHPGQPRPSGAAPMRSEGMYSIFTPFIFCQPPPADRISSWIPFAQHNVLTTLLYRLLDRGRLPALDLLSVFRSHKRRYNNNRSSGGTSRGRHAAIPQSTSTNAAPRSRGYRSGRLLLQHCEQQPRRI